MDAINFYISNLSPAIVRTIATPDGDMDILAGQTFNLRVRSLYDSVVLLDKAMTPDTVANTLTYQPVSTDTPFKTEGVYRAWVYYVNAKQDTDEFQINVFAHAPGEGTRVGAVWRAARALEPVSWDSLRHYPDYGDVELQRQIELAKLRVLPTAVVASDEVGQDPRVIDYIAKKVLVDNVLSAAISLWTDQTVTQTARGNTEEVVTYPDRIRAANDAIARYTGDLERQLPEVEKILGAVATQYDVPMVSDLGPTLTPGLNEFPAMPVSRRSLLRRSW